MLNLDEVVYSMRQGLVIEVKDSFDDTEPIDSLRLKQKNYLTIQHDDCSFAKYEFLKKESVIPKVGERVGAGEVIANVSAYEYDKGYRLKNTLYFIEYDRSSAKVGFSYFQPNFLIKGERQKIESGRLYQFDHSVELIIQELSKKQKKRFRN